MTKPILAITMGDPGGIGPEVVLKSLQEKKIYDHCRPLIIGDAQIFSLRNYRVSLKIKPILNPAQAQYRFGTLEVLHIPCHDSRKIPIGKASKLGGKISARAVKKSVELACTHLADGVAHAPISKMAWKLAGIHYPGHTEMIAHLCARKKIAMAIVSEPLRSVLVTRHLPLNQVSKNLKTKEIVHAIELACEWMNQCGLRKARIGVCALNPHAGEKGLMGKEEIQIIQPAISRARTKLGNLITGPLPADSAFRDHKNGLYDCLITMYHDQSLIPIKLFNSDRLVNITLGLPFPRTSPGHGTAFEIAGKNCANAQPMLEAILTAARLFHR